MSKKNFTTFNDKKNSATQSMFHHFNLEFFQKMDEKKILQFLMKNKLHFGCHKQFLRKELQIYVSSFFKDFGIINLKLTLLQLRKAMFVLYHVGLDNGKVLVVDSPFLEKKKLNSLTVLRNIFFIKRSHWIPGLLSNKRPIRNAMSNFVLRRERFSEKRVLYRQFLLSIPDVDVLIILGPINAYEIINEASIRNIPIIALADLNCSVSKIDYPIICNNQDQKSLYLVVKFLCFAYQKGFSFFSLGEQELNNQKEIRFSSSEKQL